MDCGKREIDKILETRIQTNDCEVTLKNTRVYRGTVKWNKETGIWHGWETQRGWNIEEEPNKNRYEVPISQIKQFSQQFYNRLNEAKEKISDPEDKSFEIYPPKRIKN